MASVFTGPRFTQARRLAAFVASFVLIAGLLGALAPGALSAGAEPAQTIGVNSCIGQDACTGATGNIGSNSCNGNLACFKAQGDIANYSCNGWSDCYKTWRRIRHDSCNGGFSCYYAQGAIGAESCQGWYSCNTTRGRIGNDSCNGARACWRAKLMVGDASCNGLEACMKAVIEVGDCANNLPGYLPLVCGYLPDGRIRTGSGPFVGNDIYNTTGTDQANTVSSTPGSTIRFGISVQNDSVVYADSFTLLATGTTSAMYGVTYFKGTTNITADVVAGTYTTPTVATGATYLITARVKVRGSATAGSSVTRLVTITSLGDGTRQDAVVFTVGVATP